ncbi:DUF2530 domain-containing protein [Nocardioides zeae]|uniref:DUF2530 domain-containing protein n=1 Tax=Nocardioides imazamoxiresistens TaxID=3231893 RepID=A0ABU3PYF9_9ACTN|nr:DUF2530 domain-containing protein [Nocardioides zeae]MDT9594287.1 DUF2530 domain-containing protein [Nocardioides zeae]
MDLRDDQPTQHEIGRRTYVVADVEPLDVDGVHTVVVGSIVWAVAFVALLPFYSRLTELGLEWVLWTCLAGLGLGLLGLEYCRRRRRARAAAHEGEDDQGADLAPGLGEARDDA